MSDYILVKDALINKLMIIKKSMICTVEEATHQGKAVRKITYVDNRPEEFVSDTLLEVAVKLGVLGVLNTGGESNDT